MKLQTLNVYSGEPFDPSSFSAALAAICEDLRTATNDPLDQIKLFIRLAQYQSPVDPNDLDNYDPFPLYGQVGFRPPDTPIGVLEASIYIAQQATAALCRRMALSSLAKACSAWTPSSSTEATLMLQQVVPLFDAEILYAGDQSDDRAFNTLRALRAAVVADLEQRAVALPSIITIKKKANLPSLVLAYDLYRDASRSTDLELRANPIHPLFMQREFEALSR